MKFLQIYDPRFENGGPRELKGLKTRPGGFFVADTAVQAEVVLLTLPIAAQPRGLDRPLNPVESGVHRLQSGHCRCQEAVIVLATDQGILIVTGSTSTSLNKPRGYGVGFSAPG